MPYRIEIAPTFACNSKCKLCFISRYWKNTANELSLNEFDEFFKNLDSSLYWLAISGGEPFLRKDIDKIILSASENCRNLFVVNIATNGILTKQITKKLNTLLSCMDEKTNVFITLNTEVSKIIPDNKALSCKNKTYKRLKKYENRYPNLSVIKEITINKYNLPYIVDYINELDGKKEKYILGLAHESYFYKNENEDVALIRLDRIKILRRINEILRRKGTSRRDIMNDLFLRLSKNYFFNHKKQVIPCYSSFASLLINPYGDVYPCISMNKRLGNIRKTEYKLQTILRSKKAKRIMHNIKKGRCDVCWTPCEAYQTMIQNIHLTLIKAM
jgi:radical SAM protein with 4Fe4S-binding SPASM domain